MLDELLNSLLARQDNDLRSGAIILPTQRLCLYCQLELAHHKTSLFTPLITTLESFLTHLHDGIKQPIIADQQVEYIIATMLKGDSYQYLQANFAREINTLFQAITHSCTTANELGFRLNATINTDNEAFLLRQQKIHAELEQLYLALQEKLTTDRQTTTYFALQAQVHHMCVDQKLQNFAFIYVMPPLKPTKLQETILGKIYQHRTAKRFKPKFKEEAQATIQVMALPSANAEVYNTFAQVKKLITDKRCSPAEIAIVPADISTYLPALRGTEADITTISLHLPVPLRMTSVGMFLQMLCDYQTDTERALLDLLHSPHTAKILPKNFSYDRHQLAYALTQAGYSTHHLTLKNYDAHIRTYLCKYSQGNRFAQLAKLIAKLEFLDDECFTNTTTEELLKFLRFMQNSSISKLPTSVREFWRFVADKFLQLPLHTEDEKLAGVQVISLNDACYMPFKHVYVLGCTQQKFPQAYPVDFILSNHARRYIGLPSWSDIEELAKEKFKLLSHNATNLNLCYPANQVPSQFLGNMPVRTLTTADVYRLPKSPSSPKTISPYQPKDLKFTRFSAYRLENFMRCPMRYLLNKANVTALELPEHPSPLLEGTQLHQTIERLVNSSAYQRIKRHQPQAEREKLLTQELCQVAAKTFEQESTTAISQHFFGWRRLARFLLTLTGKETVDDEYNSSISIAQQQVELVGKIDHTVIDGEFIWLLEYKRNTIPNQKDVAEIISPQLLLYAYLYGQIAKTIVVYFGLLKGEHKVIAAGSDALTHAKTHAKEYFGKRTKLYSLEELVDNMKDKISHRYDEIRTKGFFADPTAKHCRNCDYASICREEDAAKWAKV